MKLSEELRRLFLQPDFLSRQIGTCHSCRIAECATPKVKKVRPENGCSLWQTPNTVKFREVIEREVEIVEKKK